MAQPTQPPLSETQRHLRALAGVITQSCPDLRERVRSLAAALLDAHGIKGLEPEQVYWHRFAEAATSPRTFSGWAHYQAPVETLTLVQLVMRRFETDAQDAPDELDVVSGFYTAGAEAERYDEHNEVRLLPHQVMDWLWATDLKAAFLRDISAFWSRHGSDFRLLAKAHFMGQVLEERQAGALSDNDLRFLLGALVGGANAPLTLEALAQPCSPQADARVYLLQIGSYVSTDILCVENPAGEHFVWMPGEVNSVQKFSSSHALHWWLLQQNKDAEPRARFMSHFALSTYPQTSDSSGLNQAIDLLYSHWGREGDAPLLHRPPQPVTTDAFTYLAERTRERMHADAMANLHSNGEQRKKLWISYLGASSRVFGPFAAIDWPVALAVVGAGLANMGLNIDQAVNASTLAERKAAVLGAIVAGIDTLFNALYFWGAWAGEAGSEQVLEGEFTRPVQPEPAAEPPAGVDTTRLPGVAELPAGPLYVADNEALAPFQTNLLLDGYPLSREGKTAGVYVLPDGETYVDIGGQAYAVRYAPELQTWVVVDPENPFSFYRNVPLRRTRRGEWEVIPRPGLKGGGRLDRLLPWVRRPVPVRSEPRVPSAYDLPKAMEDELAEVMLHPLSKRLQGYVDPSRPDSGIDQAFSRAQARLARDAEAFFAQAPVKAHPSLPPLAPGAPVKQTLRSIFERSEGLVIGEAHQQISGKQFLIEQMPRLSKEGVRTLYMEHLLTDAHQTDLDALLSTGKLPERLKRYLEVLDQGHGTDPTGRYTFKNVVKAASDQGIQVRALDCVASYKVDAATAGTRRQQLMNFYAYRVIAADSPTAKWVALIGNSHSDNYLAVPGLADLEGVTSLRAEDVPVGTPGGIDEDPGLLISDPKAPAILIKSDLRLRAPVVQGAASSDVARSPELQLTQAGDYVFVRQGGHLEMIHRSRAGVLVHTPIVKDGKFYYLQAAKWPQINGRRYEGLTALSTALRLIGLRQVL